VVDFVLQVGEVTQAITITGEASQVETTTATVTQLVDERKVLDIPLNNRDLTQLAFFDALVLKQSTGTSRAGPTGLGDHLSVAGMRGGMNAYLLDGVSNSDLSGNAQAATTAYSGAETVKEFQVITNNYSAEYPSKPGAIVSAVTKSGTNSLHGTLFEFLRNDNLDAFQWESKARGGANPFKPEFKRNQFGGSVGGPIFRDKTFFFGSYEALRERIGENRVITIPSAAGRRGELGGNLGGPTEVNPIMVPYLNVFPLPGEGNTTLVRDLGDGRAEVAGPRRITTDGNFGAVKIDHQFASQRKGFLAFTWNVDNSATSRIDMFPGLGSQTGVASEKKVYSARHTSILSPTTLNEFTFGFTRANPEGDIPQNEIDWGNFNGVDLRFLRTRDRMGQLSPEDGIASLGFPRNRNLYAQDFWTFRDNLSLSRTNHTIKIGAEINPIRMVMDTAGGSYNGVYTFETFRRFLRAEVRRLEHDIPSGVVLRNGQVVETVPIFYYRQKQLGFYFQDNWKVRPSLTLNLGLRYEFLTEAKEDNGKMANLVHFTDAQTTIGKNFTNPTKKNFSPRFGFAWSPGGNNRSAIRGGFGIYYEMPTIVYWRSASQELVPFVVAGSVFDSEAAAQGQTLTFPHAPETQAQLLASLPNFRMFDYTPKPTYVYRWSLTLEREMAGWFGSVAYNGSRGLHLLFLNDANNHQWIGYPNIPEGQQLQWAERANIADGTPINPNFQNIWVTSTRGNSFYHGVSLNVQRRMAAGLQFQTGYNLSRNIDYGAGVGNNDSNLPQSSRSSLFWEYHRNKGLSQLNIRHNFVTNFTYDFPKTSLTGVVGALVNGWQMNGILSLSSGSPFTLTAASTVQTNSMRKTDLLRPNLVPGGNNNPVLGNPDRWVDETQFVSSVCRGGVDCYTFDSRARPVAQRSLGYQPGFWGNLGSNTVTAAGLKTFDFSVTKNVPVTETKRLQFRAEFFNLSNTPNFRLPSSSLFSNNGSRTTNQTVTLPDGTQRFLPGTGNRVNTTRTTARQIQFGLKFIF